MDRFELPLSHFFAGVLVGICLIPTELRADWTENKCQDLAGPFSSEVGDPCSSPIGMCTHGVLEGDFPALYDFTFLTLENAGDPDDPTKFVYTGYSVVTATDGSGVMYTDDTGEIHMPDDGSPAPFVTTAVIQSGTQKYHRYTGAFIASGNLDLATGQAVGSYTATLCKPKPSHRAPPGKCFHPRWWRFEHRHCSAVD